MTWRGVSDGRSIHFPNEFLFTLLEYKLVVFLISFGQFQTRCLASSVHLSANLLGMSNLCEETGMLVILVSVPPLPENVSQEIAKVARRRLVHVGRRRSLEWENLRMVASLGVCVPSSLSPTA